MIPLGCGAGDPADCSVLRGGEFLSSASSTWQNNTANISSNIYALLVDPQFGYSGRAELGFDVVSLPGTTETVLKNQTVGGFAATDTYLGIFGINPRSSDFLNSTLIPSYLQNLRDQFLIPSLSWGYTAGNQYRKIGYKRLASICWLTLPGNGKTFGSLTLGGYDRSRFNPVDGSWPIDNDTNLAVQLQSITGKGQGFLPTTITVFLDSSLPYMWLPVEAYTLFEIAFGLDWDATSSLYLVNDTLHRKLLQQNTSLSFLLSGMTRGSDTAVNITLPYAAFDLTASTSLVANATRYFPLKRATSANQYTLGQTFFQEAYVVADYERKNFSVFPCKWAANTAPDIASTFSPTYTMTLNTPPDVSTTPTSKHKSSSNAGAIAGGTLGGLGTLAIAAALLYLCWWRTKRRQHYTTNDTIDKKPKVPALPSGEALGTEGEPHITNAELANTQRHELEGSAGPSKVGLTLFELPAREDVASELRANNDAQEILTPDTSEAPQSPQSQGEFPWRRSVRETGMNSPSPLGSPETPGSGTAGLVSPVSIPGLVLPLPAPSL